MIGKNKSEKQIGEKKRLMKVKEIVKRLFSLFDLLLCLTTVFLMDLFEWKRERENQ